MKKIFYSIIVAGLALVSAACQKLDEQKIAPDSSNNLTVTASIVNFDGTKVSYAFSNPENVKSGIKPSWETTDAIFGFDDKGGTFSFPVASIDDNGKATFSTTGYSPAEGVTKLYAVYYPGKSVSDLENNALDVDLSSQSGTLDGDAPAIMCATGTIKDDAVNFAFTNQTAVVGIYKMQVYKDGAALATKPITGVSLGNVLTQGTVKLDNGEFKLVPSADHGTISATGLELTTDGEGCVEVSSPSNTYFAVIPEANASITVNATDGTNNYKTNASITGNINAGSYYYLGKKIYGGEVATVGGTSYATVSEAFAAATDGDEIQLQNDCTFDSQITLAGKTGEITLDLNGCTLKNGPTLNNKQSRFYLNTEATLVIRDSRNDGGTITSDKADQDIIRIIKGNLEVASGTISAPAATNGGNAAIWVEPGESAAQNASVTITGGNIQGPATVSTEKKYAYALYVENPKAVIKVEGGNFSAQSNSMRVIDAASVDITGGTFTCETEAQFTLRFASSGKNYTCNISGDAVVNSYKTNAVRAYGDEGLTVNISGGKYNSGADYIPVNTEVKDGTEGPTISITGGLYSREPKADFVAENYACVDNTDPKTCEAYPYKVAVPVTLTVGSGNPRPCKSVEVAVTAANSADADCTIKLLESVPLTGQPTITNKNVVVTLDLNGKKLTYDNYKRIRVDDEYAQMVITDMSDGRKGEIVQINNDRGAISHEKGKLTISGGTISNSSATTQSTVALYGGELIVNGGKITNSQKSTINMYTAGTLTVTDGEIECTSTTSANYAIKLGSGSGNVDISGGNIQAYWQAIDLEAGSKHMVNLSGDCVVTSTNTNTIISRSTATDDKATVTVTGGKYKSGNSQAIFSATSGSTTTYSVKDCKYNGPDPNASRLAQGYTTADNTDSDKSDYPKKVVPAVTLTIGSGEPQPYASVEAAIEQANKDENKETACTITLNEDVSVTQAANVMNSEGVTINLNNHTLTNGGKSSRISIASGGKLIIDGEGTYTIAAATNVFALDQPNSTLILNGGTIKSYSGTYPTIYPTNGNFEMYGGEVNTNGAAAMAINFASPGTMKLNGGKIISSGHKTNGAVYINNAEANVEIDGTEISNTFAGTLESSDNPPALCLNTGKLEFKSGKIGSNKTNDRCGIKVVNGDFTMTGGTISAIRYPVYCSGTGKITISGGCIVKINGGWSVIYGVSNTNNSVNLTDGYFYTSHSTTYPDYYTFNGTFKEVMVSGGYFTEDISNESARYSNYITVSGIVEPCSVKDVHGNSYNYEVKKNE